MIKKCNDYITTINSQKIDEQNYRQIYMEYITIDYRIVYYFIISDITFTNCTVI